MNAGARLTAALSVSLAVHAVALATLEGMPRGWGSGTLTPEPARASALRLTLRAEPTSIEFPIAEKPRFLKPAPEQRPSSALGLAAPVYYPASELDERPLIRAQVEPRFPPSAPAETGRVVLRLYIDERGNVDEIAVVDTDPAGPFETAAIEAFAAAQFRPGMRGGVAVKSQLTLELLFGAPVPADPSALRASSSEREPLANPNAAEAPDRAAVRQRPPRHRRGA